MSRRTVNEQATRKGVFVQVSVVADHSANPHEIRDAIRAASAKTLDRFMPPRVHEHVHFAVAGQMTLPYPEQ